MKKKILFVCLGNICRSPLAHGIAEKYSRSEGLDLEVDSAGTSDWHSGEAPCDNSIKVAKRHNVDISQQQARTLRKNDISYYDYVVAMDRQNRADMLDFGFKNVYLLGDFADYKGKDVPDPYFFTGASVLDGFEKVFTMVELCIEDFITKGKNGSL